MDMLDRMPTKFATSTFLILASFSWISGLLFVFEDEEPTVKTMPRY